MATNVRSVDFLPEIFQTPVNQQFLAATLDQLIQEPAFKKSQGFIGRRIGPGVNANDRYVVEPTQVRNQYQLEPGVCQINPDNTRQVVDAITYPGINEKSELLIGLRFCFSTAAFDETVCPSSLLDQFHLCLK